MDNALQAILDSLPPRRRRSKLEPYAALIRALRARGRSYRDIVTILRDRCGLHVATHTVFHFVQAHAQKSVAPRPSPRQRSGPVRRSPEAPAPTAAPSTHGPDEVWTRIAALKQRPPVSPAEKPKAFDYDEHMPLQLIADAKPPKR